MIAKCQTPGAAWIAALSVATLLSAGCASQPQTAASAPPAAATLAATPEQAQPQPASSLDAVRLGLVSRSTALIGKKAQTRREKGLGRVQDFVLDLSTGRVVAVVISSGGDQLTPVPARSFWTATKNLLLVSTDWNTFERAPRFLKADSAQMLDGNRLSASFRHFGQRGPDAPASGCDGFCAAASLIGLPLASRTDEPLGQVAEIMVDVPVGRIACLVMQPAASTGSSNTLYVVPPQSVRLDASRHALVLNADRKAFLAGPHFQPDFWTDMAQPELMAAMLQHYDLEPGRTGLPDPTRQPARARTETAGASGLVPAPQTDQEISAAVVTEIVRIHGAFPTREFKITTTQGRVLLSGRVRTDSQKRQLGEAAARVVGVENVDNQISASASR